MRNIYEYFTAESLTDAQSTLAEGPSGAFATVASPVVDPVATLGSLEEILTGRSFTQRLHDASYREEVAGTLDGDESVIRIDRPFVRAVADAETADLLGLVAAWAQADDDLHGATDLEALRGFLFDFQRLCSEADESGDLYCWVREPHAVAA